MATIIIILLATVLIPFVAPQRHKNNAMLVAWSLLFFVWDLIKMRERKL